MLNIYITYFICQDGTMDVLTYLSVKQVMKER